MSLTPLSPERLRLAALALLTIFAGCGGTSDTSVDLGQGQPDRGIGIDRCDSPAVRYRITDLRIPTPAEADSGVPVGHNVDATGDICGVPDYVGGVDNSLIDLSSAFAQFAPPAEGVDLQAAIDAALTCAADADPTECTRLDLIVSVVSDPGCTIVTIEDGQGTAIAGPFAGTLDGSGNLSSAAAGFSLPIPYQTLGGSVTIHLHISTLLLTANVSANALTDIVLGGAIHRDDFEETLMAVLPLLGDVPTFDEIAPIIGALYDVMLNGTCSALSVGFTGSAQALPVTSVGAP